MLWIGARPQFLFGSRHPEVFGTQNRLGWMGPRPTAQELNKSYKKSMSLCAWSVTCDPCDSLRAHKKCTLPKLCKGSSYISERMINLDQISIIFAILTFFTGMKLGISIFNGHFYTWFSVFSLLWIHYDSVVQCCIITLHEDQPHFNALVCTAWVGGLEMVKAIFLNYVAL